MKIVNKQFGQLEISEDLIIKFPKGIIGFEDCKQFVIINDETYEPFRWLIAVDQQEIGFPVLNPFLINSEFGAELPNSIVEKLLSAEELMDVFCVVTLKGENGKVTINLKSPIIIDYKAKEGEQVILSSEELPVARPIS